MIRIRARPVSLSSVAPFSPFSHGIIAYETRHREVCSSNSHHQAFIEVLE